MGNGAGTCPNSWSECCAVYARVERGVCPGLGLLILLIPPRLPSGVIVPIIVPAKLLERKSNLLYDFVAIVPFVLEGCDERTDCFLVPDLGQALGDPTYRFVRWRFLERAQQSLHSLRTKFCQFLLSSVLG